MLSDSLLLFFSFWGAETEIIAVLIFALCESCWFRGGGGRDVHLSISFFSLLTSLRPSLLLVRVCVCEILNGSFCPGGNAVVGPWNSHLSVIEPIALTAMFKVCGFVACSTRVLLNSAVLEKFSEADLRRRDLFYVHREFHLPIFPINHEIYFNNLCLELDWLLL